MKKLSDADATSENIELNKDLMKKSERQGRSLSDADIVAVFTSGQKIPAGQPKEEEQTVFVYEDEPLENDIPAAGNTYPVSDEMLREMVLEQLTKEYENMHRMSVDLSTAVFTAIGKTKLKAKKAYEDVSRRVDEATATVEDATRKLGIIERRYMTAIERENEVKQRLSVLPYVSEAAVDSLRVKIEDDRKELADSMRGIPRAEQLEMDARTEAVAALHMMEEPETAVREKKKLLDLAEKHRNLTDYLYTVAKTTRDDPEREEEFEAIRREATAKNMDYIAAHRAYTRALSLLRDVRNYAQEKRRAYEEAHRETTRMRSRADDLQRIIHTEEKKISGMTRALIVYSKVYAEYQEKKKTRIERGSQLEAARKEYARLMDVLSYVKAEAETAADRLYRAEKISVRDVVETKITDADFLYLNKYGALLQKAQADEEAALGKLRRAQKSKQS